MEDLESQLPRSKGKHSGIDYLTLFLTANPDIEKVTSPSQLSTEHMRQYQRFRNNYNSRLRYAENREKYCEQKRQYRKDNLDHVRAVEARYRAKPETKLVKRAYEQRDYVKERHKRWKESNPEKQREYHKAYRERYYEKECERVKEFLRHYRTTEKYSNYKEKYLKTVEYRWSCIQNSARPRNLVVELTKEDLTELCAKPCFYCGEDPKECDILFGVDRLDNTIGYTKANSVTCCTFCNYAKCNLHIDDFTRGMCNVAATFSGCKEWSYNYKFKDESKAMCGMNFSNYRSCASKRGIEFQLSEEEFNIIVKNACFYCQNPSDCGIDRMDNSVGYLPDNCVSCCSLCNRFKKDWEMEIFVFKANCVFSKFGGEI